MYCFDFTLAKERKLKIKAIEDEEQPLQEASASGPGAWRVK